MRDGRNKSVQPGFSDVLIERSVVGYSFCPLRLAKRRDIVPSASAIAGLSKRCHLRFPSGLVQLHYSHLAKLDHLLFCSIQHTTTYSSHVADILVPYNSFILLCLIDSHDDDQQNLGFWHGSRQPRWISMHLCRDRSDGHKDHDKILFPVVHSRLAPGW